MSKRVLSVTLGVLLSLPAAAAEIKPSEIAGLAFLEGRWSGTTERGVVMEEYWTSPAGGGLVGLHKDVKGDRMVSFEFFRIHADGSGRLCYFASPNGGPPTAFCAVELEGDRVVFENRDHDFPQRILYWLDADGNLHARIEGDVGGKPRSTEWVWTRMREEPE